MQPDEPAVSIVLPTFNEAASLPVIVPRILESLRGAGVLGEIIIVDDNSPDGTADVAEALAQEHPVRCIRRTEERGLATAVLRGFDEARAPICVVMDADGSHPTAALPRMVELIAQDKADIVVGSRHVPGGGSHNWPLFSQLKSKLAALMTFGLTSMTDPTTGFMALRKALLPGLQLDPIGWKIVLEIAVKAAPVRIAEVPIVFEDRELGESKQSLRVFAQYAVHVANLYAFRYPSLAELVRFCVVGLLGMFVDLSAVIAAKELLQLDTRLCAVLGFALAVTTNFALNRRYTFARGRELPLLYSYFTYVGTNLFGLSVRMLVVHLLIVLAALDAGRGYVLSNFIGIVLATLVNFVGAKYFAFDPQRLEGAARSTRPPAEAAVAPGVRWLALGLVAAIGVATLADATAFRQLRSGDESVNLTMARNVASDARFALRPSVFPGGRADWVAEDLPALGNTPFFAILAAPLAALGLSWAGLVPWLALLLCAGATYALLVPHDRRAALFTLVLLASSPSFVGDMLSFELEPVMLAFCALGALAFVRGTTTRQRALCALGGALAGLGFLTKMWLIVPYALAACGFVLVQTTLARAREDAPLALRRSVIAGALGFAATASLHLVAIAWLAPQDLGHWLRSVYLGIFSGEGITGGKLSAQGVWSQDLRPASYYPLLLLREHGHLLPLLVMGLPALVRRGRTHAISMLAMAAGSALAIVVLSVPLVKEPLYLLATLPLLYALAGTALSELEADPPKHGPGNRTIAQVAGVLAALLAFGWLALAVIDDAPRTALAACNMSLASLVVAVMLARRKSAAHAVLIAGVIGALCGLGLALTRAPLDEPRPSRSAATQIER
jgi:dolichol-phosphate mannosyltransferase